MRKAQKKQAEGFVELLGQAHDEIKKAIEKKNIPAALSLLADCQDGAISLGELIEKTEGEDAPTISILEGYCEKLYQIHEELSQEQAIAGKVHKTLRQSLTEIKNSIKNDIKIRQEIVFLPYKASMWDSLESVWKATKEDPDCDAYVIPIPYYDKNPDGSFREKHYEGDQYPYYVPVVRYEDYDFEKRMPDKIFIHNPYDQYNYVTSVEPFFYSSNLKKFTEQLVYIPYFILEEIDPEDQAAVDGMKHFCTQPGVINADRVIVQSEAMRQIYVNVLTAHMAGAGYKRKYWEDRILGLGSPKVDKVLNTRKEDLAIPKEWLKVIQKPDGSFKKIVFYNTSVSALLQHNEKMLVKMRDVFSVFKENRDEVALLWRPHPLIKATINSMRPQLWAEYEELVREYREDGWGIYDDSADVDRAVILSDAYYGDGSSVVDLYQKTGKPVMMQNADMINIPSVAMCGGVLVDNDWYFVSIKDNVLYKMNTDTFKVYYVRNMLHDNEAYMGNLAYSDIIYYEDKLIFVPAVSKYVAVYYLRKETAAYVPIQFERMLKSYRWFNGGVVINDILYLIPCRYDKIVAFNMKKEIIEDDYCIELPCVGKKYTNTYSLGGFVQEEADVIFTSMTQNKIFKVNLKTGKIKDLMPINNEPLAGVVRTSQGYIVFPAKCNKIYIINENAEIENILEGFPSGYECGEEWSFDMQQDLGDVVVLLPRCANKLLCLDKSTYQLYEIDVNGSDYDRGNFWDRYIRYAAAIEVGEKKIIVETKTGRWHILNKEYEVIDTMELDIEENQNDVKEMAENIEKKKLLIETEGPFINVYNYIKYVINSQEKSDSVTEQKVSHSNSFRHLLAEDK